MLYYEFKEWLEENSSGTQLFAEKALDYQLEKNRKRTGKNKWNDAKVQRAADGMYNQAITGAYDQIKAQKGVPKINGRQIWIDFMQKINFVEIFNEGVSEVEFE